MKTKITVMLAILLMGTAMAQDRKDRPNRKGDRTEISAEQKAHRGSVWGQQRLESTR